MSRIGNRKIALPTGVSASLENNVLTVKGAKGTLTLEIHKLVEVVISETTIETKQKNESKEANINVGTMNSLISNMVIGVSEGFSKGLEAVGVGYRFQVQGNKINISAGFSHPVAVVVPEGLKVEQVSNTEITISGIDKQKVAEFAANIRKIRQPEPYKGKGIRYKGEYVRRKEGKKAAK
ncbi:MAG: 50S ribosomal protein L6 [Bacilli bacterium]|nr:50S ribosomal protein L6 [Bacilli bacterium]